MSQETDSIQYAGDTRQPIARWVCFVVLLAAFVGVLTSTLQAQNNQNRPVSPKTDTFYAVADPQINVPKYGTEGTKKTIKMMNNLPGTTWPYGGKVHTPRGVLIPGDLVDKMSNKENWKRYTKLFDPRGNARLKFPVFAGTGNHDLTNEVTGGTLNWLEKKVVKRNQRRPANLFFGPKGFHYSWNWGIVHFVNLNIFPGNKPRPVYGGESPWNDPKNSLEFLKQDLKQNVKNRTQPIVLMWHYGLRGWGLDKWWTKKDLQNLKQVIEGYNVILILHGHEHAYRKYKWEGYDVMMAPAPQHDHENKPSTPKGFVVFRVRNGQLESALRTPDGWERKWKTSLKPEK